MEKLKIGVIGLNEGNGHPYSWSAIFNGYDSGHMEKCPFPAIPQYLAQQNFPKDGLGHLGQVTNIWTQDKKISEAVALASKINNISNTIKELVTNVDAVLLARDDAEHHYDMAIEVLNAGIPVFIDKPLALTTALANKIINAQKYNNQVFTCSSSRYAQELQLTVLEKETIGEIKLIEGSISNKWNTYAIHLIEPIIMQIPNRGKLKNVSKFFKNGIKVVFIEWENVSAYLKVTGSIPCPYKIDFFGQTGYIEKSYSDSFNAFKSTLEQFIMGIKNNTPIINRNETLEIIEILEKGSS
ncbi:MAG: Gfo/Idh/MocA family oxidoreductase [Mucilaginibacter sp.]